jgi:hypothetical protein
MAKPTKATKKPELLHWEMLGEEYSHDADPDGFTYRAKVPGGWLVAIWAGESVKEHKWGGGLTFVPDPTHAWEVKLR